MNIKLACASFLVLSGCGAAASRPAGLDPNRLAPTSLYPLHEGYVWSYNVDTGTGVNTFAVSRVTRASGTTFAVSNGGDEIVYEVRDDGIFRPQTGTYLLKAPIDVGASWSAPGGATARVTSVTERIEVPAGSFEGCVEVVEDGGEAQRRIRTVYCAGAGPAVVESTQTLEISHQSIAVRGVLLGLVRGEEDAEAPAEIAGPR
jgi:hypothetical protein